MGFEGKEEGKPGRKRRRGQWRAKIGGYGERWEGRAGAEEAERGGWLPDVYLVGLAKRKRRGKGTTFTYYWVQDGNGLKGGGNVDWSSNEYYQQGHLV